MITIDKAIKNLKAGREDCGMIPPEEFTPTIDLAREALKEVERLRSHKAFNVQKTLPGETEPEPQPTRDEVTRYMNERKGG
ncbi:hypothetical protein ES707_11049 [subsurface metagenome]|jgi:hypothetical protein